jgi:hypothetical protein
MAGRLLTRWLLARWSGRFSTHRFGGTRRLTCSPDCYQSEVESGSFMRVPPVSCPGITSASGLHLPGLTPADEANSAGVSQPREV